MAPTRPQLLLLDAGAVFGAHEHQAWTPLCNAYKVVVPSTVVRLEAEFYIDADTQERHELDLVASASAGTIIEFCCTPAEIASALARFREPFLDLIDPGEAEALAYLLGHDEEDSKFITTDGPAIEAVCMLGLSDRLLSLEEALSMCGYQKKMPWRYSASFVKRHQAIGSERLVTRQGLR